MYFGLNDIFMTNNIRCNDFSHVFALARPHQRFT